MDIARLVSSSRSEVEWQAILSVADTMGVSLVGVTSRRPLSVIIHRGEMRGELLSFCVNALGWRARETHSLARAKPSP